MSADAGDFKKRVETSQVTSKILTVPLLNLPEELLEKIFSLLSFQDGKKLYHVNQLIRNIVKKSHFEWADGRRLEFLLMMDATASMRDYLASAKLTLSNLLETLKNHQQIQNENERRTLEGRKKYHLRTAWLEYRDIDNTFPVKFQDFTDNPDKIVKYIENSMVEENTDIPENVAGALQHALNDLTWTQNSYCHSLKIIVLVLDAPPHGMGGDYLDNYPDKLPEPYQNADWIDIAHQMKKKGIIVHTLLCVKNFEQLNLFGTTLSNITGGKCLYLENSKQLGEYILANICADIELEDILSKQLKALMPERTGNEEARRQLGERLFKIIEADRSLMIPTIEAQTVNHLNTIRLSRACTVTEARNQGTLPQPRAISKLFSQPVLSLDPVFPWNAQPTVRLPLLRRTDEPTAAVPSPADIPPPTMLCRSLTLGGSVLFSYGAPTSRLVSTQGVMAAGPAPAIFPMSRIAEDEATPFDDAVLYDDATPVDDTTPLIEEDEDETHALPPSPIFGPMGLSSPGIPPFLYAPAGAVAHAGSAASSGITHLSFASPASPAVLSASRAASAGHLHSASVAGAALAPASSIASADPEPSASAAAGAAALPTPEPLTFSVPTLRRAVTEAISSEVLMSRIERAIRQQRTAR